MFLERPRHDYRWSDGRNQFSLSLSARFTIATLATAASSAALSLCSIARQSEIYIDYTDTVAPAILTGNLHITRIRPSLIEAAVAGPYLARLDGCTCFGRRATSTLVVTPDTPRNTSSPNAAHRVNRLAKRIEPQFSIMASHHSDPSPTTSIYLSCALTTIVGPSDLTIAHVIGVLTISTNRIRARIVHFNRLKEEIQSTGAAASTQFTKDDQNQHFRHEDGDSENIEKDGIHAARARDKERPPPPRATLRLRSPFSNCRESREHARVTRTCRSEVSVLCLVGVRVSTAAAGHLGPSIEEKLVPGLDINTIKLRGTGCGSAAPILCCVGSKMNEPLPFWPPNYHHHPYNYALARGNRDARNVRGPVGKTPGMLIKKAGLSRGDRSNLAYVSIIRAQQLRGASTPSLFDHLHPHRRVYNS
ncbi:hypothetical protein J6590_038498 [Homalodisca vitripennis]|nr:hypothetical protein J6590_038498 [Homalodisca vitripennis]